MKLKSNLTYQLVILLITFMGLRTGAGQSVDYDKIILPRNSGSNIGIEEKLVQLAWRNNPQNRVVEKDVELADLNAQLTRRKLTDIINFTGNVNEFVINPSADRGNFADFFPKYNVAINIPLGLLFTNPVSNKVEEVKRNQSIELLNAQKLKIREEVLKAYNIMMMHEKIYRIDVAALNDAELSHSLLEEKFKVGEEAYGTYMTSLRNLNDIRQNEIRAEADYKNAKLALEAIIGVRFEDVL